MTYLFHSDAEAELNASVDYYEECKIHLGLEFTHEVYETIQRIIEFPTLYDIYSITFFASSNNHVYKIL